MPILQRYSMAPAGVTDPSALPDEDKGECFWFWCPGCRGNHRYVTRNPKGGSYPTWGFNGDMERPTFTPSLLINGSARSEDLHPHTNAFRCHLFVTNGEIRYCGDCTHDLAGKTVPMEELPW